LPLLAHIRRIDVEKSAGIRLFEGVALVPTKRRDKA